MANLRKYYKEAGPIVSELGLRVNPESSTVRTLPKDSESSELQQATEKATLVIRGLQSRLRSRTLPDAADDPSEDLEQQLQKCFATSVPAPERAGLWDDIRDRVVEGVAERILRDWGQDSAIEAEVVERLINRILEQLGAPAR